jgi:hypothetical protein
LQTVEFNNRFLFLRGSFGDRFCLTNRNRLLSFLTGSITLQIKNIHKFFTKEFQ